MHWQAKEPRLHSRSKPKIIKTYQEEKTMTPQEHEDYVIATTYPKRDIVIEKGEGPYVWDSTGKRYLDFMTNVGVNILGHCNPEINKAITRQLATLTNLHGSFYNTVRARCAEQLVALSPKKLTKVFFSNSGTESVEAALKFARLATGRKEIIAAKRGYHGKTFGALSATATDPKYNEPFFPLVPGFDHCRFNDAESLRALVSEKTAAVILEPIQGEGGIRPAEQEFLTQARDICSRHGALLIFDEVQCGMGRTGAWCASEWYGIEPDIMCLSKAIANGIPMAATLVSDAVAEKLYPGCHTNTFGSNPLACAATSAVIDYITKHDLLSHVQEMGDYLSERITALDAPLIREVRGKGLMVGIELKTRAAQFLRPLQEKGLLINTAGSTTLRMLPPYIIEKKHIDEAAAILGNVLSEKQQ